MKILFIVLAILVVLKLLVYDYFKSPKCKWCKGRHYGRCIFNPRAGKFLANVNDGYYDYHNPNE